MRKRTISALCIFGVSSAASILLMPATWIIALSVFTSGMLVSLSIGLSKSNAEKQLALKSKVQEEHSMEEYLMQHEEIVLSDLVTLKKGETYQSCDQLVVYFDQQKICYVSDFDRYFPDTYHFIHHELQRIYDQFHHQLDHAMEVNEGPYDSIANIQKERGYRGALEYIDVLDAINIEIADEPITNGVYNTSALLKQVILIENKYPNKKRQLVKLYDYYLPILLEILNNYIDLKKSHGSLDEIKKIEDKLLKTILLVNEAIKTICATMMEEEVFNLSADISVLETILKSDGLVQEGSLGEVKQTTK